MMVDDESTLLAESRRISSPEIELVSPTSMTARQQTSQDTSVDIPTDDSTPCCDAKTSWFITHMVSAFLVTVAMARCSLGYIDLLNVYVIPSYLAYPFSFRAYNWASEQNSFILNICKLVIPAGVTCVSVLVGTVVSPVALVFLPWLFVSFLLARLLQFIRHGDAYDNLVILKFYTRIWMYYLYLYSMAPALALFVVIASNAPVLRDFVLNHALHPKDWQIICIVIIGMLCVSTMSLIFAFTCIPPVQLDISESGINILEAVLEMADCVNAFFGLRIVLQETTAPILKHHNILGLGTWKWIQGILFIICIYNFITIVTHLSVLGLQIVVGQNKPDSQTNIWTLLRTLLRSSILRKFVRRRYLVYWGNGMKHSINFILSSLMILLFWVLYFRPNLNKKAPKFWEFGVWTCLSFLTCASLWVIKICVLLSWEAGSIYERLESKILQGGKQLHFLGIIGRHSYDIFNLLYHDEVPKRSQKGGVFQYFSRLQHMCTFNSVINPNTLYHSETDTLDIWESEKKLSYKKKNRAKDYLLVQGDQIPTIFGIQQAALYFLMAKSKLLEEEYTSVILKKLERKLESQADDNRGIEQVLKKLIGDDDWNVFRDLLNVGSSESVSFETLQAWMEMAHNNCLFLANTLSSGKEVVDCLNNIISSVIIFASFITWLLLTGLATTQVLSLIAAPLLAGTFIFQNTCKVLFEGIMFAYVVHPFNVGDLCVVDEKMMEVRTVGVWKTTFSKIGTQEEVIYTNSELANKSIVNHKTNFDWDDSVELDVSSLGYGKIKNLRQEIEKYLDGNKDKYKPGYNSVEVWTTGDIVKLIVYFRHNVSLKDRTFLACFKEKRKLRSEFVLEAENLADRNRTSRQSLRWSDNSLKWQLNRPNSGDEDTSVAEKIKESIDIVCHDTHEHRS